LYYNTIHSEGLKVLYDKDFNRIWRNEWQNREEDAKWAAKKDVPAGKSGTK
jgi:hypothetical protein